VEIIILIIVAFVQNMAFTWVSRSRNSGDPGYHRYAAYCSNSIWFVTNVLIWRQVWTAIESGNWWYLLVAGLAYTIATSEGSVLMMKRLLKSETGKRQVGARG
jgi:putative flippase GtrA